MNRMMLLIMCCALLVVPSLAQNSSACSPTGTWYGGSDYKYMLTITPITGERFSTRYEAVYNNAAWGYAAWTSWSGELGRVSAKRYVGQATSMYTTSPEPQPPPASFELDAVRAWMEFTDCDNIKLSYDFFGAYFDLNKVPFVDPPDLNYLPPGGIVETYHRVPTTCPACSLAAAPTMQLRQRR